MPRTTITLPRVEPVVPTLRPHPFSDPAWLFEPKYDGFRGVLYLTRQGCTLYSKRGNRMTRFQSLADQLCAELGRREVILDGEIVALDDLGRIDFWELMRGRGALAYAAFDLLGLNGRDLRDLPLSRRKKRLERLIPASVGALNRVPCSKVRDRSCSRAPAGLIWRASDGPTRCVVTFWVTNPHRCRPAPPGHTTQQSRSSATRISAPQRVAAPPEQEVARSNRAGPIPPERGRAFTRPQAGTRRRPIPPNEVARSRARKRAPGAGRRVVTVAAAGNVGYFGTVVSTTTGGATPSQPITLPSL
jgi:hypothetical protein